MIESSSVAVQPDLIELESQRDFFTAKGLPVMVVVAAEREAPECLV